MKDKHRPFSCGTQYIDWENNNCCQCAKYSDDASRCDIMYALSYACIDDGAVSTDIAERMGYLDNSPPRQNGFSYNWRCKEFQTEASAEREAVYGRYDDPNQMELF